MPALLAPLWHTRLLLALLLAVAATGATLDPAPAAGSRIKCAYLPLLLAAASLAAYVVRVGLGRSTLSVLLGETWNTPRRAASDVLLALLLASALWLADGLLAEALSLPESVAGHALLPTTTGEKVAWLVVGASVGVCEELVYRGYLQRQLAALTGRRWLGVVLQALLFGIAHGEQGGPAVARIALYGLGLGWLAAQRQSLLPGIVAHIGVNASAVLAVG